jgi:hypothetical protein
MSLRDELGTVLERFFREAERVLERFLQDLEKPSGGTVSLRFNPPTKDQ